MDGFSIAGVKWTFREQVGRVFVFAPGYGTKTKRIFVLDCSSTVLQAPWGQQPPCIPRETRVLVQRNGALEDLEQTPHPTSEILLL